jgi:arsenate reductase
MAKTATIYHNPKCETSRNVLAILRERGIEPRIVEYLKTPPSRAELKRLVKEMGAQPRDVLRWKEKLAAELKLDKDESSGEELLDAMAENPILINRPIVVIENAVKLCRPSETVKELLG